MSFERGERIRRTWRPPRRRLVPLARRALWARLQELGRALGFRGTVVRRALRRRLADFVRRSERSRLLVILRSAAVAGATAVALLGTRASPAEEIAIPPIELSAIARGEGGFEVRGEGSPASRTGTSVSGAGDVNGDGIPDLIVEGQCFCLQGWVSGYVVFGKPDGETVELADIVTGRGGFAIRGAMEGRRWSLRIAGAGDVNGDGLADVLAGARYASPGGRLEAGESYVVFGKPGGETVALQDMEAGRGGFAILGGAAGDHAGSSVAGAGDVDGDAFADVLVGAPVASPDRRHFAGESYIVLGKTGGDAVDLRDVRAGEGGFAVRGVSPYDRAGWSVAGAGDLDDDGLADLLVGAPGGDPEGRIDAGETYVVFGKPGGEAVELRDIQAEQGGFAIRGSVAGYQTGSSLAGAQDVNGDGLADLIIGTGFTGPGGRNRAGESYVIFGKPGGDAVQLGDIRTGRGGFAIRGGTAGDYAGASVAHANDVNGDGLADLLVGAPGGFVQPMARLGESYVIFGKPGGEAVAIGDVQAGRGGFAIRGAEPGDQAGSSVAGAGDLDGDGLADLLVGAPVASPEGRLFVGESYVVFGKPAGDPVELREIQDGQGGFSIRGTAERSFAPLRVAGTGDVNGDGLADFVAGAPLASPGGRFAAGESQVVFGKTGGETVELRDVQAGRGGFTVRGMAIGDYSGVSVAGASDVNGDGLADIILRSATETHVVFGKPDGEAVELGIQAGRGGFAIRGSEARMHPRQSVAAAGDVDGDGLADVIVGDFKASPGGRFNAGESYVVFGKPGSDAIELQDVRTGRGGGFAIRGVAEGDESGYSVAAAGDVNGDGLADIIVGAYKASPRSRYGAGECYVIFGKTDAGAVELGEIRAGRGGFAIQGGADRDRAGFGVAGVVDVNGDGLADLLVGAPIAAPEGRFRAGECYVVFGKPGGEVVDVLEIQAGRGGFVIQGAAESDRAGWSVAGAGDVNRDGFGDIIVDAAGADPEGRGAAGEGYVIFGRRGGAALDLQDIQAGQGGFTIRGGAERNHAGWSVESAGDVNADGSPDVLVAAGLPGARYPDFSAAAHVVFGVGRAPPPRFRRGAVRGTDDVQISDAVRILGWLLLGDIEPPCLDAADADDSGSIEITDAVRVLCWLFLGDCDLPAPGPLACGIDPTSDEIECAPPTEGCEE